MIETHAFGVFIPPNAKYLVLGSFTAKKYTDNPNLDWFYVTPVNQFWPIIEQVYNISLRDQKSKQKLFEKLGIATADIIHQCERRDGTNLDANLVTITYNTPALRKLLKNNKIEKLFFTNKFVEASYKKHLKALLTEFPDIELITLPSPSPRYAAMRKEEKAKMYKDLLPKI